MKIELEIKEELMSRILSYGGVAVRDLSEDQLSAIKENIIYGVISRWEDEPHYAFDDFFASVVGA